MNLKSMYGRVSRMEIIIDAPNDTAMDLLFKDLMDFSKEIFTSNPGVDIIHFDFPGFDIKSLYSPGVEIIQFYRDDTIEVELDRELTINMILRDLELVHIGIIEKKIGPSPAVISPEIQAATILKMAKKNTDAIKIIKWLEVGGKRPI